MSMRHFLSRPNKKIFFGVSSSYPHCGHASFNHSFPSASISFIRVIQHPPAELPQIHFKSYFRSFVTDNSHQQEVNKDDTPDDGPAQYKAALHLFNTGVVEDRGKGFALLKKAADQGYGLAQLGLGEIYDESVQSPDVGVHPNRKESFFWYEKAANHGIPKAQLALALCYSQGVGVAKDLDYSMILVEKAADQGDPTAQHNLSVCYMKGDWVIQDNKKAAELCQKAAKQGFDRSQYNLGVMYSQGSCGCVKDRTKAIEWLTKAANQGNVEAWMGLFRLHLNEKSGEHDPQGNRMAMLCLEKAASLGNVTAQLKIGQCYEYALQGFPRDVDKMFYWYEKASQQENPQGQHNLAVCYGCIGAEDNSLGVTTDEKKAVELYTKAAQSGFADSQHNLGMYYEFGIGVDQDFKKAFEWYSKAAAQGMLPAVHKLGRSYMRRAFSKKSVDEADLTRGIELFQKGVEEGYFESEYELGRCYKYGWGIEQDLEKAVALLEKAFGAGAAPAGCELYWCLLNGEGVKKDENKAAELLLELQKQGGGNLEVVLDELGKVQNQQWEKKKET